MITRIHHLTRGLAHLFYPQLCEACNKPLLQQEKTLCIGCEHCLPYTQYHSVEDNETTLRLAGRFPFRYATSLAYFTEENSLQHLLHRLKYKERQGIGIFLGRQLGTALKPLHWQPDAIVPVPLYPKKLAKRGFNQSELIAEGISEALDIPVWKQALQRVKNTGTQTDKTRQERIENVQDAFRLQSENIGSNQHILLVDDVLTTGATLEACARELLKAKGITVSIATIGIAV